MIFIKIIHNTNYGKFYIIIEHLDLSNINTCLTHLIIILLLSRVSIAYFMQFLRIMAQKLNNIIVTFKLR